MAALIWTIIQDLGVAWLFCSLFLGLALLLTAPPKRRPPHPTPPHEPFVGRLVLPDVFPGPASKRRRDYLHEWVDYHREPGEEDEEDEGEEEAEPAGEDGEDEHSLLMFDRSKHEASMARRLEIVRRQREGQNDSR